MKKLDLCYNNNTICRAIIFDTYITIPEEELMKGIKEYDDEHGHHMIIPVADNVNIKKIQLDAPDYEEAYGMYLDLISKDYITSSDEEQWNIINKFKEN